LSLLDRRGSALLLFSLVIALSGLLFPLEATAGESGQQVQQAQKAQAQGPTILVNNPRFPGLRRIPLNTVRARIVTKAGDVYDAETLQRDFMSLWNTGFFEDLRLEVEVDPNNPNRRDIIFHVVEKPLIRTLKYEGNKSVTVSEILDRFKEKKVGITTDTPYDAQKVRRAEVVLEELLAERGRGYATVKAEPKRVPPNSVILTFKIDEGPKVKVGKIEFEGNKVLRDSELRWAMKHLRPIGIPKSIVLESIFSRAYDESKMVDDLELVRTKVQDHGYFTARVMDPKIQIRDTGGLFHLPLIFPNKPGKAADITIPVEEGELFHVGKITFSGVKFFRQPDALFKPMFGLKEGDTINITKIRKGFENLKKTYGDFGFINMVADPNFEFPGNGIVNMTINIEEDKQFFVRRIEFSGNTTTRDKVIRRELLLDEGDMFSQRLWETSILRLNQLGFFEQLKPDAAEIKTDNKTGQVDITLKVKERGKNSIGLNGGVSGLAGSFIGLSYSTNNFLGLGEQLTFSVSLGSLERDIMFGFTEPYLLDRPIQTGFTVYARRYSYNQARQASILTGQNLIPLFQLLGNQNVLDFRQSSLGFTAFASKMLRRSFARVGLSYGYDSSSIITFNSASTQYFEYLNFRGVSGPSALEGIRTSKIIPSYSYNTVDNPMNPHTGKSIMADVELAGIGGNVRFYRPTVALTYFRPVQKRRNVIGFRLLGSFMSGYGGVVAPPFERFYIGGENDVRGFYIRTISPIAVIADTTTVNVLNPDGSQRTVPVIVDGELQSVAQTVTFPVNRIIFPGGDTQAIGNFEYRVPIFGPVTMAAFFDAGLNMALLRNQLSMNTTRIGELQATFPFATFPSRLTVLPKTNNQLRTSTGLELQVILPIVQAPFRLYWAYNPNRLVTNLVPPPLLDRSMFPNDITYRVALAVSGPIAWDEPIKTLRFTVSRTF
jgi:outer membrane protein insertion porin family